MTDLSKLSTAALVALYNQHADKPVSRFATRAVAEKRVAALLAAADGDERAPKQIDADLSGPTPATLGAQAAKADDIERAKVEAEVRAECDAMHEQPIPFGAAVLAVMAGADVESVAERVETAPAAGFASFDAAKAPKAAPAPKAAKAAKAAPAAEKPAKAAKTAAPKAERETVAGLTGAKLALLRMMQRVDGISAEQAAKELGWARCGATLSRVIKAATAAGITIAKVRGDDRTMRYVATN